MLYLAPLQGVTNRVFRDAFFSRFPGFDAALAPFIPATLDAKAEEKQFRDLLPAANAGVELIPQILGNEAESFVSTCRVFSDAGYREINWNLGCPFPMVANKKRGSGLLPFPDLIKAVLDQACARVAVPLSVKVRLGRSDPSEILRLAPVFNAYPLKSVTVHARVGVQMYEGEVNLEGFAEAARALRGEVVYNGDITDLESYEALRVRFPSVKSWMIGRGAVADPFLPARIKGLPLPADPAAELRAFHDDLYREYREILYGPKHALDKMKELWGYFGPGFSDLGRAGTERSVKEISRAKTIDAYERAVDSFFAATAARARASR